MTAPAAQIDSLIAPFIQLLGEFLQGEVRPLTAEENNRPRHGILRSLQIANCKLQIANGNAVLFQICNLQSAICYGVAEGGVPGGVVGAGGSAAGMALTCAGGAPSTMLRL